MADPERRYPVVEPGRGTEVPQPPPRRATGGDNGGFSMQTLNDRGQWVPSIPVPFYALRKRCECGRRFWTAAGYRGHYALVHILALS